MDSILSKYKTTEESNVKVWFKAAAVANFSKNGGACVKYKDKQIAVFNFNRKGEWYACQNVCPHKLEMVLSRGMLGDDHGILRLHARCTKKHSL